MNISGTQIEGTYYSGDTPLSHSAVLVFSDNEVVLTSGTMTLTDALNKVRVSPRAGRADRFITLSNGGQFQCTDQPFLDFLPQEISSEGIVAWLEDRLSIAVVSVAIIIGALIFGYYYGIPAAAESMIKRVPIETEVSLGGHVLTWFDDNKWFDESHIKEDQQVSIMKRFNKLHEDLSMSPHIRLEFRNSEIIGPNAFAFPGGLIVITDQMVEAAESEEEILAILAHELGHAEMRHSMRQIVQSSFVALAATTITADAASLSAAVAGLPVFFAQTKYSRDFEREADEFAFDLLRRHHISTEAFASLMERLDANCKSEKTLSFLSTHPITEERITEARESNPQ